MKYELGFIGAGNMAEAIARGAIHSGVLAASQIAAADPSEARRAVFSEMGVKTFEDAAAVVREARQVMLAVKPQVFPELGGVLQGVDIEQQVVLSIMAGVGTRKIESVIGKPARIVRTMPNTPLMVGCGMAGVAMGEHSREGDAWLVMRLLEAGGRAIIVEEEMLDAVTAVSGSGPAYVFYLAEAMLAAAGELGLGEHGPLMVAQTIAGAAKLMEQASETPAELRRKVTSPGGTTAAAIGEMEAADMASIIVKAIRAAEARSRELGA